MYRKIVFMINIIAMILSYYVVSGRFVSDVNNTFGYYTSASKMCIVLCASMLIVGIVTVAAIDLSIAIRSLSWSVSSNE